MPKKVETWICDICGHAYDYESDARDCEMKHARITRSVGYYDAGEKYPEIIYVDFSDANSLAYERCGGKN